jgi:hypothetical protein
VQASNDLPGLLNTHSGINDGLGEFMLWGQKALDIAAESGGIDLDFFISFNAIIISGLEINFLQY